MFCSKGNEEARDKYKQENDISKFVQGFAYISGHWFRPWYEEGTGKLIGTRVFYINQTDMGASMPFWMITKFVPSGIMETFNAVRDYGMKIYKKK